MSLSKVLINACIKSWRAQILVGLVFSRGAKICASSNTINVSPFLELKHVSILEISALKVAIQNALFPKLNAQTTAI